MKRFVSLLLVLVLCIACFPGCAAKAPEKEEAAKTDEKKTIGVIIGNPAVPFFQEVESGITSECKKRGWDSIVMYGLYDKVLEAGRTFIAQDVDAIVDFGTCEAPGKALYDEAKAAGIPKIDVDVPTGGYYFGANNPMAGEVAGKALAEIIKERGLEKKKMKAVLFHGSDEGPVVAQRLQGVIDALIEAGLPFSADNNYTNDTVIHQIVDEEGLVKGFAKNQISTLGDQCDLIIFVSVSDVYGPAMVAAVEETDMKDRVLIATHNESKAFLDNLKDPDTPWVVSTAYQPYKYGEYITKMCDTLFAGGELPAETLMDHVAITAKNMDEFIDIVTY